MQQQRQFFGSLVKETHGRLRELDTDSLIDMLWAVATARAVPKEGATKGIVREDIDEELFRKASEICQDKIGMLTSRQLAELTHAYVSIGIKDTALFNKAAPRILAKQNELSQAELHKCIQAYAKFGIPLRTTAKAAPEKVTVVKGDFQRPSEWIRDRKAEKDQHPVAFSKALTNG